MTPSLAPAPALTVRQAAGRIVARQVRALLALEAAARRGEASEAGARRGEASEAGAWRGEASEAVHQMRVQTRRLRAAAALFAGVLRPPRRARSARLRWLARALGRVRDLDVILALLEERHLPRLEGAEAGRLENLVAALKERRWLEQERLADQLGRRRYVRLRAALKEWARHPRFGDEGEEGGPAADTMAARYLTEAIRREAQRVAGRRGMTERQPSAADLHALRIAVKRLRYVLDFHAETCGVAFDAERRLARALQDCLGEIHDHDLLLGWFAEAAGAAAEARGGRDGRGHRGAKGRRRGKTASGGQRPFPEPPVEAAFFAGPWLTLPAQLAAGRAALLRRFLRLRRQWRLRTEEAGDVAPLEEPRFVNLEAAPVQLRLPTPQKTVASLRLVR